METLHCIFCNNTEKAEFFREEDSYTTHKCLNCHLIYLSPRPTEKEMKQLYEGNNSGGNSYAEHLQWSYTKELENKYTIKLLKKYKDVGKLLELGSGGGQFLLAAEKADYEVFATEMNSQLVDSLREEKQITTMSLENGLEHVFPGEKFDIVYHKNVISHMYKPIKTFEEIYQKLQENGILVFETGNIADLSDYWVNFLGKLSLPEHVFFLSQKNINQLLEKTGFKMIKVYRHPIIFVRVLMKFRAGFREKKKETRTAVSSKKNHSEHKVSFFKKCVSFMIFSMTYKIPFLGLFNVPTTNIYIAKKMTKGERNESF